MSIWLSDAQIDSMCEGIKRNHERLTYLRSLGLTVKEKPNGKPLVMISNVEAVLGGVPSSKPSANGAASAEPDRAALVAHVRKGHGKKTQG